MRFHKNSVSSRSNCCSKCSSSVRNQSRVRFALRSAALRLVIASPIAGFTEGQEAVRRPGDRSDLSVSLTRLRRKGGVRLYCCAVQRFSERTVTGCNRHTPDLPAEITGEAKTIDHLVALIEVRPQTSGGAKLL